jgi:hypothetical protein
VSRCRLVRRGAAGLRGSRSAMAVVVLRGRGGLATVFPASRRRFIRPGRAGRFARRFGGLMRRGPGERRPSSGFARERSPLQLGSAWWRRPPVEAQLVHVLSAAPRISERSLPRVIPGLWADWSPGYDARDDVPDVLASLQGPRATAALRYYRAFLLPWMRRQAVRSRAVASAGRSPGPAPLPARRARWMSAARDREPRRRFSPADEPIRDGEGRRALPAPGATGCGQRSDRRVHRRAADLVDI